MRTQSPQAALLVLAAATASAAFAQPMSHDPTELVFDFRPRIASPRPAARAASQAQSREDKLSAPQNVHLHVYHQPLGTGATQGECHTERRAHVAAGNHVGLVLSGGVSKGLAFVGVLDVIDQVGIRVDKIAGTSMGAVIGSFYAAGYSPRELYSDTSNTARGPQDGIINQIDWRSLFSDVPNVQLLSPNQQQSWGLGEGMTALPRAYRGGLRSGQNLSVFLGNYLLAASAASNGCFDNLYVPFRANATNASTAVAEPLREGDLATAVRASLSYPGMLTPVHIDGKRYIDGGILDNYPVNTLLERPVFGMVDPSPSQRGKYRAILGFDVSDTKTGATSEAGLLQLKSMLGIFSSVEQAIGTAISRETGRSSDSLPKCRDEEAPNEAPWPCLLHVKVEKDGGFTDFAPSQIAQFVAHGRAVTLARLCSMARVKPCPLDPATIEQVRIGLELHGWGFLLHDPMRTITQARAAQEVRNARPRLLALIDALGPVDADPPAFRASVERWRDILQGLQIKLSRKGLELLASPALQRDDAMRGTLLRGLRKRLRWLEAQLTDPCADCAARTGAEMPDFDGLARLRVAFNNDEEDSVTVSMTTWEYELQGLVIASGLTEAKGLERAALGIWGLDAKERERVRQHTCQRFPTSRGACPADLPAGRSDGGASVYGFTDREGSSEPVPLPPWKHEVYETLQVGQGVPAQPFDVRYFRAMDASCTASAALNGCRPQRSLPAVLEGIQKRYYANAAVEHFRISSITSSAIEMSEKDTSRAAGGALYGSYQHDYRNKHTFGLRHVYETDKDWALKPTRVVTSVALNEPAAREDSMQLLSVNALYFPSIHEAPADFSVNPYIARRNHRIGSRVPRFQYDEHGLAGSIGFRPFAGGPIATFIALHHRWLSEFEASDLTSLRELLHDSTLGERRRATSSIALGARLNQAGALQEHFQFAVHRSNHASFNELFVDVSAVLAGSGPGATVWEARFVAGRMNHGRRERPADEQRPPPVDELYSLGGHYPLAERSLWGRKRVDYLGVDINGRWGSRLLLLENRVSLLRWDPPTYFAPYAKVQLDAVLQQSRIGFKGDPQRRWRGAGGFVASAYLPAIASVKLRASLAVGGESRHHLRLFSSLDLLL